MATHPDAVVWFHAPDMILRANTDVSYLAETKVRSHAAGYLLLGMTQSKLMQDSVNGQVYVNCKFLKFVAASTLEAETGGCFVTGRDVIISRNTL